MKLPQKPVPLYLSENQEIQTPMATATLKPSVSLSGGYTTDVDYGRVRSLGAALTGSGWEVGRTWDEYQKHGISLNVGGKQVIQGKTEAIATLRQELESFIPRHRYYLEYFRFTDSSFFESEAKYLTSIPP